VRGGGRAGHGGAGAAVRRCPRPLLRGDAPVPPPAPGPARPLSSPATLAIMPPMAQEKTYVMLKPGVLQRRLVGEIIGRLERKGLQVIGLKLMQIPEELAKKHYAEHDGKPFFGDLISYITSGPVVAMVIAGEDAISRIRLLAGATKVEQAQPGTIRGDFASVTTKNIIHASDSTESAEREIGLFFGGDQLVTWDDPNAEWTV
jgi:nucleoside-diphosphate kinase